MDLGLTGKVALITGGSYGIGRASAISMGREGAHVAICARRGEVLEEAAMEVREKTGAQVLPIQADVTQAADIERTVQSTVDHFGRLDILVNNAGSSAAMPFEEITDEQWEADLDLKVWASIRFSRLAIPHLPAQAGGGRIINVTNIGSKTPGASSMPTAASRAAGNAITKALSKDLGKDNITVNSICIGLIKSGQMERRYDRLKGDDPNLTLEDVWARGARNQNIPLGRVGGAGRGWRCHRLYGIGPLQLRQRRSLEPGRRGIARPCRPAIHARPGIGLRFR